MEVTESNIVKLSDYRSPQENQIIEARFFASDIANLLDVLAGLTKRPEH